MSLEKLKEAYDGANSIVRATMRASSVVLIVSDSKVDRSIKVDTLIAAMRALVCDIQIGTIMEIIKTAEKVGAPADAVMCHLALIRLDDTEGLNRRVSNMMDLFKNDEATAP